MVILAYKAVGGKRLGRIIPLAASIELIHTATLIHDDMNDSTITRRGKTTVYSKYGMAKALIMGDYLFTLGFKLGGRYGEQIVDVVAELSRKLAEGEFVHLNNARNPFLDERTYLKIIEYKTAGPFLGGARIGAIIGGGRKHDIAALGEFGRNIGMAFQIMDDIFDIAGDESHLGKQSGVDLKNGKITLPTICALKDLKGQRHRRLIELIKREQMDEMENAQALELIRSTSAVDYSRKKARSFVNSAVRAISGFRSNDYYRGLTDLSEYIVERTY